MRLLDIVGSKMDKLKKNLVGEYRAGSRWLAYDTLKSTGWLGRLRCFPHFSTAAEWCRTKSGREGIFRIRALAEVLAALNGVRSREYTAAEMETLLDLVERRPISSYKASIPLTLGLLRQRYFPVLWKSMLEPLSVVQTYYIVNRQWNGLGKWGAKVLGSYPDFGCSIVTFKKAIRSQLADQELLMVGGIFEKADLTARELLPADGVILFYRSAAAKPDQEGNWEPEIQQMYDPTEAMMVQTAYFAAYDGRHRRIIFFDGGLRRAELGNYWMRLDLEFFDFDRMDIFEEQ
jgi:hypothetical protein